MIDLEFEHVVGDGTDPQFEKTIIAHIVNDYGGWGRGFVVPLRNRFPRAEFEYRAWSRGHLEDAVPFRLGSTQFVKAAPDVWVANMCAQHGDTTPGNPAVDYEALEEAFFPVLMLAVHSGYQIQMPEIGCGLGGGTWDKIEDVLMMSSLRHKSLAPIPVTVTVVHLEK